MEKLEEFEAHEIEAAALYIKGHIDELDKEPVCPNHAKELTYEDFARAADTLIDPFSKVIERYYAEK